MGDSSDADFARGNAADELEKEDIGNKDTLIGDSPSVESLTRASDASKQSNDDSGCERSSDESTDDGSSSDDSTDDELYSRDIIPDLEKAREILQAWHFLPKLDDYDSDDEKPPRPESPTFMPSEEYQAIQDSAKSWSQKLENALGNAYLHRLEYAKLKQRDFRNLVKVKDFVSPRPKSPLPQVSSCFHDEKCPYHTRPADTKVSKRRSDSFGEYDALHDKKVKFQLPPPPRHFIELLDKAEKELLIDISQLCRDKDSIMKKPAVTDKYFPPLVYKKIQTWPEIVKGYNAIHDLECEVMRKRIHPVVMMARTEPVRADAESQDEDRASESPAHPQTNGNSSGNQSPRTLNHVQAPLLLPRSRAGTQPSSIGSSLRGSPMHRAVDRLLTVPATPNPSPALSNDAGETLGNLTELTERLEIATQRINSAGVVPQSRFASPAYRQGMKSYTNRKEETEDKLT